ncbi:DUF4249 domain-containing protein [Rudanella lutea]|uniref:DUF4249 domain-containing protein n=1 Tax=Rudanella lutea TaxID=451374 RepID=UPI000375D2AD|nr:DUF4249 domain-containing protein [Rudanella lutea]
MYRLILCLGLIPLFFSCDSLRNEVDPDRINREAGKLVIASFISPQDSVLTVQVNRSVPVLGQSNTILDVTNASVTISDGARVVALQYAANYRRQAINLYWTNARNLPILPGKTYTLSVSTPQGEKATAQCTIPVGAPVFVVERDSARVESGYSFSNGVRTPIYAKEYSLRVNWADLTGGRNYYRVAAMLSTLQTAPSSSSLVQVTVQNTFFNNSDVVADSPGDDGGQLRSRKGVYYRYSSGTPTIVTGPGGTTLITCPTCATTITNPTGTTVINPPTGTSANNAVDTYRFGDNFRSAELTVSLLHTDETYYRYHEAIPRQQESDGNPFAEPVQIPSNINGGLGCFAGFNRRSVVLKLK